MFLSNLRYKEKILFLLLAVFVFVSVGIIASYKFLQARVAASHREKLENSAHLTRQLINEKQNDLLRLVSMFQNNNSIVDYLYIATVLKGDKEPLKNLVTPIYISQKTDVIRLFDHKGGQALALDTRSSSNGRTKPEQWMITGETLSGFTELGGKTIVYAIGPMKHFDAVVGYVFVGKYIDGEFLSELRNIIWSDLIFVKDGQLKESSIVHEELPYKPENGKMAIDGTTYSVFDQELIGDDSKPLGIIVTALSDEPLSDSLSKLRTYIFSIFAVAGALSFALAILLIKMLVSPLSNMVTFVERVSKGDFDSKMEIVGDDEIAMLTAKFNEMQGELKKQRGDLERYAGNLEYMVEERTKELVKIQGQLIQSQKMESLGTLAGGLAHDFNNVLSAILGYASFIKEDIDETHPHYRYWNIVEQAALRGAELTGHLMTFARGRVENKAHTPVDVNEILKEVLSLLQRTIEKSIEVKLVVRPGDRLFVMGDAGALYQAVMNICINARDAMPSGGKLIVEASTFSTDEDFLIGHMRANAGDYIRIDITDSGVGMSKDVQKRIFEPFFTTKGVGRGTGLGLAIVYNVINEHKGFIDIYSEPDKGTIFKIYLPASSADVIKTTADETYFLKADNSGKTVLVVDDEEPLRKLSTEILESVKYEVITAENGAEAVSIFQQSHKKIDIVILDMIMPGMSGHETYLRMKAIDPDLKVLISSGFSKEIGINWAGEKGVLGFIEKPYRFKNLLRTVYEALAPDHEMENESA